MLRLLVGLTHAFLASFYLVSAFRWWQTKQFTYHVFTVPRNGRLIYAGNKATILAVGAAIAGVSLAFFVVFELLTPERQTILYMVVALVIMTFSQLIAMIFARFVSGSQTRSW